MHTHAHTYIATSRQIMRACTYSLHTTPSLCHMQYLCIFNPFTRFIATHTYVYSAGTYKIAVSISTFLWLKLMHTQVCKVTAISRMCTLPYLQTYQPIPTTCTHTEHVCLTAMCTTSPDPPPLPDPDRGLQGSELNHCRHQGGC